MAAKNTPGWGFFFWGGRDCFLVVAGNASGALHQVRSALLLNWLLRHRKLPPTCINRTIIVCRKHSRVVFTLEYLTLRLFLWCEDVKVKNRRCKDLGKTLCHQWLGERDGEQSYQQTSITSSHSVCLSCTVLMDLFDLFNVLRYKSGQVVVFLSETDMMNTGLWRDSCLSKLPFRKTNRQSRARCQFVLRKKKVLTSWVKVILIMMMMMMKSYIAQSFHAIVACSVRSVG